MIIDSHCHAWSYWPYQPAVPDPESRGTIQQLLHEMQLNQVDQALVVCAQIDHNPDNNAYIAAQVAMVPDRLYSWLISTVSGQKHTIPQAQPTGLENWLLVGRSGG
jgi:Tat protein secretion system quality control protein TatD with DNase activity